MEDITIKSITHCPTCGSECKVEGGTTHYYIPVKKYTEEDIIKAIAYGQTTKQIDYHKDFINSLKKQN
jgi:hypothetical protein